MDRTATAKNDRFLMWVDAVGGFWVCLGDQITLGQPAVEGRADVPILGDLSKRHARIRRDGEGYLIEAFRPVYVDGQLDLEAKDGTWASGGIGLYSWGCQGVRFRQIRVQ